MRFLSKDVAARAVIGVAIAIPFSIVAIFGVNVTVYDEWPQLFYLFYLKHGILTFDQLWLDGNLHRQLFSRLFSLLFNSLTSANAKAEMLCSATLTALAFAVLARHLRNVYAFSSPALAVLALVVLSTCQIENFVSGFDNSSVLVLVLLMVAAVCLDRGNRAAFAFAVVAAVVASYSLFQGLFVWPGGLALLFLKLRNRLAGVWAAIAAVDIALYFFRIHWEWANPTRVPLTAGLAQPFALAGFALGMVGSLMGSLSAEIAGQTDVAPWWIALLLVAGAAVIALGAVLLREVDLEKPATPLALYFLVIAAAFVPVTTLGRVSSGWFGSNVSRYSSITMLLLVGLWIVAFTNGGPIRRRVAAVTIALLYCTSLCAAVSFASRTRADRSTAVAVLSSLSSRPIADVERYVGYSGEVRVVRAFAEFESANGLGSFADAPPPGSPSAIALELARAPFELDPDCRVAMTSRYARNGSLLGTLPAALPASYANEPACAASMGRFMSPSPGGLTPGPGADVFLNGGLAWSDGPPADIHVWGDGSVLDLYATTRWLRPEGVRAVKLSTVADTRSAHSGRMCIYLAWTDRATPETCVPAEGDVRRFETRAIPLRDAQPFRLVAHFAQVAPAYGGLVSFDDPRVVPLK